MSELPSSDPQLKYATEWFATEIRALRQGDAFQVELQCGTRNVSFDITEQQADQLRFLWL